MNRQPEEEAGQFREVSPTEEAWQALAKAINEFGLALQAELEPILAAMRRILDAIQSALLSIHAAWLLIMQPDLGQAAAWRQAYAAYSRNKLRSRAERHKRAGPAIQAVIGRLPDRLAIWLYREL